MQHGLIHKTVTNKHTRSYSLYAIFVPRVSHTPTQTIGTHFLRRLYFSLASIFSVNVCHRLLIHPGASFHFIIVFALLQNSQTIIFVFSAVAADISVACRSVSVTHAFGPVFSMIFEIIPMCAHTKTPNNVALMMGLKSLTDADADAECINLNFPPARIDEESKKRLTTPDERTCERTKKAKARDENPP